MPLILACMSFLSFPRQLLSVGFIHSHRAARSGIFCYHVNGIDVKSSRIKLTFSNQWTHQMGGLSSMPVPGLMHGPLSSKNTDVFVPLSRAKTFPSSFSACCSYWRFTCGMATASSPVVQYEQPLRRGTLQPSTT